MKNVNIKKLLIHNIPYVFIALFTTKLGQAWRLTAGTEFADKVWHYVEGLNAAFASALPSFHPTDMLIGIFIAGVIRLAVFVKGRNAKKYRKNMEYGSAR